MFGAELEGWEGKCDEAARLYEEGIRLARAHNVLVPVLEGLFMHGVNYTGQGQYDRALAVFEEGLALTEKVGDENYTPRYLNSLGWLHIECGDLERGLELNRRAAEGAHKRGDHESIANSELNVGDIALLTGDLALARDVLEGVRALATDPATSEWMRWRYSMHLYASLGDLALAGGNLDRARQHADECLERATRTRSRKYLVRGWRLRGEITLARRQWAEAEGALREALGVAEALGHPTQLWKTLLALGRLHDATRKREAAHHARQAAREVVDRIKARLRNPGLRASLERAPHLRPVYESGAAG